MLDFSQKGEKLEKNYELSTAQFRHFYEPPKANTTEFKIVDESKGWRCHIENSSIQMTQGFEEVTTCLTTEHSGMILYSSM
jgi:hypothetical protein